jgi:hypothetical protein
MSISGGGRGAELVQATAFEPLERVTPERERAAPLARLLGCDLAGREFDGRTRSEPVQPDQAACPDDVDAICVLRWVQKDGGDDGSRLDALELADRPERGLLAAHLEVAPGFRDPGAEHRVQRTPVAGAVPDQLLEPVHGLGRPPDQGLIDAAPGAGLEDPAQGLRPGRPVDGREGVGAASHLQHAAGKHLVDSEIARELLGA